MIRFLFLFTAISFQLQAQIIKGKVTESGSGESVQFANVYCASTMLGTTTNPDGTFTLDNLPPGKYDLTVSFVGYNTYSRAVEIKAKETLEINIELIPEVVNLPEVFVTADTSNWKRNFQSFRSYFLGTTPASEKAQILNKKTLAFYDDYSQRTLYAHAREPLVIKNEWLGYEITYDMISFQMEYKMGRLAYYGVPRFSYLASKNKATEKRWEKNRKKEYRGSLLHFFRSMVSGNFENDKFIVFELFKIPNPDRMPELVINEAISRYREKLKSSTGGAITINASGATLGLNDSLSYYMRERRKPKVIDSLGRQFKTGKELVDDNILNYKGMLRIVYKGAKEAKEYPYKSRSIPSWQESTLHIKENLTMYDNGYYEDVRSTFVEGYWSWVGTMASILPMDYMPPETK
ncbi:MAG: carboxypeptidase-like regulatory domain-containing protein [Bacteroidota bacterium]